MSKKYIILSKCINESNYVTVVEANYHFHCILVSTLVAKTVGYNPVEFYIISRLIMQLNHVSRVSNTD